jgi:hypothetical protein
MRHVLSWAIGAFAGTAEVGGGPVTPIPRIRSSAHADSWHSLLSKQMRGGDEAVRVELASGCANAVVKSGCPIVVR